VSVAKSVGREQGRRERGRKGPHLFERDVTAQPVNVAKSTSSRGDSASLAVLKAGLGA